MARPPILSFSTTDSPESSAWSATGTALLHQLGIELLKLGFHIDFKAGRHDPDWVFAATRGAESFLIILAIYGQYPPCRWLVGIADEQYRQLAAPALRTELHPVLEAVVAKWPGVSVVRWCEDGVLP